MTRREQIIQILKETPQTVTQLANYFQLTNTEIEVDLGHIEKSVKSRNLKLGSQPAYCEKCKFTFKERSKIRKPSKCPQCRSESISEPVFYIK